MRTIYFLITAGRQLVLYFVFKEENETFLLQNSTKTDLTKADLIVLKTFYDEKIKIKIIQVIFTRSVTYCKTLLSL